MAQTTRSYVEHVAIHVKDIQWHIRFFSEALGMPVYRIQGLDDAPHQAWTIGGMQLVAEDADAGFSQCIGHVGIMTEDVEQAIYAVSAWGGKEMPQGRHWFRLPEGLVVELLQAQGHAVTEALAVKPRG